MLGKNLIFTIDGSGSAALLWLALSPVSSPYRRRAAGNMELPHRTFAQIRVPALVSSPQSSIIHDR
jgi:hypothetical protein